MADQGDLIAQFMEISDAEENVARFYLSSSNWSLEDALSTFLSSQSENDYTTPEETAQSAATATADDTLQAQSSSAGTATTGAAEGFVSSATKPKFGTLKDMSKRSDSEEEGQAFYAGGSERSGQQVLGPPKRKNFREQLTDMFRMAQEHGAHDGTHTPSTGASTSSGASWGQGVRLGMTDNDHSVVNIPNANREGGEKGPVVTLKLWSQGFSINDGELRLYDDPDNKEFLETVMRGEIPHELLEMGWMVNVDVEDHRHEEYKKAGQMPNFKGSGHALGSPAPMVEGMVTSVSTDRTATAGAATVAASINSSDDEKRAKEKLNLNATAPITTIQIRLADGTRLAAQFNLSHTVADVHEYIQNARPQYAERNFILVSSFPTRELSDNAATIEYAGLKNASIMQRLK